MLTKALPMSLPPVVQWPDALAMPCMNNLGVFLGVFQKIENQKRSSYAGFRVKFDSVSTTISRV
jgi:hypothetical protein